MRWFHVDCARESGARPHADQRNAIISVHQCKAMAISFQLGGSCLKLAFRCSPTPLPACSCIGRIPIGFQHLGFPPHPSSNPSSCQGYLAPLLPVLRRSPCPHPSPLPCTTSRPSKYLARISRHPWYSICTSPSLRRISLQRISAQPLLFRPPALAADCHRASPRCSTEFPVDGRLAPRKLALDEVCMCG